MNITRRNYLSPSFNSNWNVWKEFDDLMRGFSRDFDTETPLPNKMFSPQAEIKENDKGYLLSFDVPGIKEEDIKIEFHDSVLRIFGERKSQHENEKDGTFRTEKYYGHFERSFRLPETIDEAKVEAHYDSGVLQVFLPKTPAKESKRIEIKKGEQSTFQKLFAKKNEDPH
ncbi:MAG: Hsp20/alpha crystallin family protein [Bdellovibrionaceae bacterium]|nr:Hsp20/alpha crystallin family protein [Pseudobdellovibrionaceae bacterium]